MKLQLIAKLIVWFGLLPTILYTSLAASLVERQAGPMITTPPAHKPTSIDRLVPTAPDVHLPAPSAPKDGVYFIPLVASKVDEWGYPVVQVKIGVAKVPINLAVSIHSNQTWLRHSSRGVCSLGKECAVLEPNRLVQENGKEKMWNYTGQNGLMVSGNQYKFSSFEPLFDTDVRWRLENFTVGIAWAEVGIEGLGNVDGVLGLGPGSTFLEKLTLSSQRALSLYLGQENGTLVIGGYLPKQANGNFTSISTRGDGVVQFQLQSLTIKGDTNNLLKNVMATIDPGLPDIIIPKSVQEFLTTNGGIKWTTYGDRLQFGSGEPNEGNRPSFLFDLGDGVHVEMGEEAYTLAKEPAFRVGPDDQIILGRPFLRSAYLVMDNTHTTYHLAQANVGNTDINNPTAITVFGNGQGDTGHLNNTGVDTDPNNSKNNTNINKHLDPSGVNHNGTGMPNNIGIIMGGIIAGLAILALIVGGILYGQRRSQRQVHEIKGYMGSPKCPSQGSVSEAPPTVAHRSASPRKFTQENTHLMEEYTMQQQHTPGSRGSIFREEMGTAGPTPQPLTSQYNYEEDDNLGGLHGPDTREPLRRDQDLVRTESILSTTDVTNLSVERSTPHVPRLPIYNCRHEETAL